MVNPDDTTGRTEGERIARLLGLEPLPDEGGLFRRTHIDAHSSAIYYLLLAPDFSAVHRLGATETYHWYGGAPLRLLLLHPDGDVTEPVLGPDVAAGQRPQVVVPAGTWQGSSPAGTWSLVGTTTAPPFDWSHFELGDRAGLCARYPSAGDRIRELTRHRATGPTSG
jgi:predicted cupin superfamily sugar epimerase